MLYVDLVYGLLALLFVLDNLTTLRCLELGGREANPLIRWVMEKIGAKPALWGTKAAVFGVLWYVGVIAALVVAVLYVLVVANNILTYRKLKNSLTTNA